VRHYFVVCTVNSYDPLTALHNADPGAVHVMYSVLLPAASMVGVSADQLRQQLEREYELSMTPDADIPLDLPTEEERASTVFCVHELYIKPGSPWTNILLHFLGMSA
jgi:hypothetical protein